MFSGYKLKKIIRPREYEDFEHCSGHNRPRIKPENPMEGSRKALVRRASEARIEGDKEDPGEFIIIINDLAHTWTDKAQSTVTVESVKKCV